MITLLMMLGTLAQAQEVKKSDYDFRTVSLTEEDINLLVERIAALRGPGLYFAGKDDEVVANKEDSLTVVSKSPSDFRVRFEGDIRAGARTLFGPRDGTRITEALTRINTELRLDTENERVGRISVNGLFGMSQTADRIVSDQGSAEHVDVTGTVGGFYTDDSLKSSNRFVSTSWEVQFRRIQADPIGIRSENGVNLLPFVIEQGSKYEKVRAALGVRYEATDFDRDFLSSINSQDESNDRNIGVYCELRGDIRASDKSGFAFQPYFTGFFRNASAVETLQIGADLSINPIPSVLREEGRWTERCMLGATFEYANFGNDPTDSARYLGLFMGVRF